MINVKILVLTLITKICHLVLISPVLVSFHLFNMSHDVKGAKELQSQEKRFFVSSLVFIYIYIYIFFLIEGSPGIFLFKN